MLDKRPNGEKLGVLCFVSNHPPRASAGDKFGVHSAVAVNVFLNFIFMFCCKFLGSLF